MSEDFVECSLYAKGLPFLCLIDLVLTCGPSSDLLKTGNFVESKAVYIYTPLFNVFP